MPYSAVKAGGRSNGKAGLGSSLVLLVLLSSAGDAKASEGTLDIRHGGPFTGLFGLPGPAETVPLADGVPRRLDLTLQIASHAVGEERHEEELLLDGESWRGAIRFRTRLGPRWQVGVELPWMGHSGGQLDGLIDDWHAVFGLPDGNRNQRPNDELEFLYRRSGSEFLFDGSESALGDLRLSAIALLRSDPRSALAVTAGVELPTGDAEKLTGNGAIDLSLGAAWSRHAPDSRWRAHVTGGLLRFGGSDLPVLETRDWGAWLQSGVAWKLSDGIALLGSIQAASSPFDSGLGAYEGRVSCSVWVRHSSYPAASGRIWGSARTSTLKRPPISLSCCA